MSWSARVVSVLAAALSLPAVAGEFRTVGLYVWKDSPDQHGFWKACGIDTLQFCDTHWFLRQDLLGRYYADLAADVDRARGAGFRVWIILFSNIAQWEGPEEREPTGMGVLFDPRDATALERRLADIGRAVRELRRADGFTLLAGDPGGAVRAGFGALPAEEWVRLAGRVREVVRREAPEAGFNVNPWAIAYWQYPALGCESSEWWVRETELTRAVLAAPGLFGPDAGVELPGHAYYRALALRALGRDGLALDLCPAAAELVRLRERGVARLWAWPYFLLDEADDGDVGPDGRIIPGVQIETRYIHRLVGQMRALGMDGIVGNWSYAGHLAKALNTYAFGRFCQAADATPEGAIDEYARGVADDVSWPQLAQVLRFVEGLSNWQKKLPPEHRLPPLACALGSAGEALEALAKVRPNPEPGLALPEPPAAYLKRLEERLLLVAEAK